MAIGVGGGIGEGILLGLDGQNNSLELDKTFRYFKYIRWKFFMRIYARHFQGIWAQNCYSSTRNMLSKFQNCLIQLGIPNSPHPNPFWVKKRCISHSKTFKENWCNILQLQCEKVLFEHYWTFYPFETFLLSVWVICDMAYSQETGLCYLYFAFDIVIKLCL